MRGISDAYTVAQVVGFDMVDDESKPERRPAKHMKTPEEWDLKHNPAYAYYAFYTYANLYTLNKLREARGLNTFALRPHAGCALRLICCSPVCHARHLSSVVCKVCAVNCAEHSEVATQFTTGPMTARPP